MKYRKLCSSCKRLIYWEPKKCFDCGREEAAAQKRFEEWENPPPVMPPPRRKGNVPG